MARLVRQSPDTPRSGFLGPTSYAATLLESGNIIKSLSDGATESPTVDEQWVDDLDRPDRPVQIQKGATCLALLQDMPTFEPFIENWCTHISGMSMNAPWLSACVSALKTQIYDELVCKDTGRKEQFLVEASSRIFENTMKPLIIPSDCSLEDFAQSFTSDCLRWEAVGIYFNTLAEASMAFHHINARIAGAHFLQRKPRMIRCMLEASEVCRSFCEEIGQMTDPEIWLQIETGYAWSLVKGDASYVTWQRFGDLVSACIVRGLHEEIYVSSGIPFWLSELRKRAFAIIYNEDKQLSSFVGRPPRLQRKYCVIQMPLDLEYEQLKLSGISLEQAVNSLDDEGWNTSQSLGVGMWLRAQLIASMVREDILEFSLTSLPITDASYAHDLVRRSRAARESMPEWIKNGSCVKGVNSWLTRCVHLNFLYNDFLLQRAMIKKLGHPKEELVQLARELLTGTLGLVNELNSYEQFAVNIPWSLAKYGLPSAGVLGLELLHETQTRMPSLLSPYRSEVIQNLSKLVACLKWAVTKYDGNYKICSQARELIQRILDRVLNGDFGPDRSHSSLHGVSIWTPGTAEGDSSTEAAVSSWNSQAMTRSEVEFWSQLLPNHPLLAGTTE